MAERRMFAKSIVLSDAFLDMPLSARCLYFTLGMLADDDGFVGSPKAIMRQCGASEDDMKVLISKRYVLTFESGVIVIKHWRINNYLRDDRHKPTTYIEEKDTLAIDGKGSYTEAYKVGIPSANQMPADGIPSIGKDSIGKDSKDNNICHEVIDYLNQVLGTHYTTKNKTNMANINARVSEGHTFDDFKEVIDKKAFQWKKDPKMSTYLRPETLFCSKHFESYLNEIVEVVEVKEAETPQKSFENVSAEKYNKIHNFSERKVDYAGLEAWALGKT